MSSTRTRLNRDRYLCPCGHQAGLHERTNIDGTIWHCAPGCFCLRYNSGDFIAPPRKAAPTRRRAAKTRAMAA